MCSWYRGKQRGEGEGAQHVRVVLRANHPALPYRKSMVEAKSPMYTAQSSPASTRFSQMVR